MSASGMKKYTQAQAREIRDLLDAIIRAKDAFHGGDLHRAIDQAKDRLRIMDEYERHARDLLRENPERHAHLYIRKEGNTPSVTHSIPKDTIK